MVLVLLFCYSESFNCLSSFAGISTPINILIIYYKKEPMLPY